MSNSIVFFGTDNFAVMVLKELIEHSVAVSLVVTTPPRPAGRGLKECKSDIAVFCEEHGLAVKELDDLRDTATHESLSKYRDNIFVVNHWRSLC